MFLVVLPKWSSVREAPSRPPGSRWQAGSPPAQPPWPPCAPDLPRLCGKPVPGPCSLQPPRTLSPAAQAGSPTGRADLAPWGPQAPRSEESSEGPTGFVTLFLGAPRCSLQGDVLTTKYQVDLGDGFKAMYMNLTLTGEPIRHRYESPGIYRVSVRAENMAGHDEAVLFVQVNCKSIAPLRPSVTPCDRETWPLGRPGEPKGWEAGGLGSIRPHSWWPVQQ